ncbi:MAG: hypothetical protein Kow0031_08510 [Anaerolineae bacterium]
MQQVKLNSTGHRIPVNVSRQPAADAYKSWVQPARAEARPFSKPAAEAAPVEAAADPTDSGQPAEAPAAGPTQPAAPDWEAIARQMQADMENFRKRQQRRADEAISAEKERLLRNFLPLADNLQRALSQDTGNMAALREGIELTLRQLEQTLAAEGVTRMETVGQPFDPAWHEAIATMPADSPPNTVVNEIEAGYKLHQKLLRPAKLIVAA